MENFSLLELISTVFKWRKQIGIFIGAMTLGTIIVVLLLSNYYTASATFVPANEEKQLISDDGGENNSLYGDDDAIDRAMIFAQSSALVDFMIKEFDLAARYGIDGSTPKGQDKVAKHFKKLYHVQKNEHSGIEISVQDHEPEMAARMAQGVLSKIEGLYREATAQNKDLLIQTFEATLAGKRAELKMLSDTLNILRRKYNIYSVDEQSDLLAEMVISTESELAESRSKLAVYQSQGGKRDSVVNLNAKVAGLSKKLELLYNDSIPSSINLNRFNEGKNIVFYYQSLIEAINKEVGEIVAKYTQFKTQVQSKASAIIVLEPVQVPKVKSYPSRTLFVIGSAFLALVLGIVAALLLETYRRINWNKVLYGQSDTPQS